MVWSSGPLDTQCEREPGSGLCWSPEPYRSAPGLCVSLHHHHHQPYHCPAAAQQRWGRPWTETMFRRRSLPAICAFESSQVVLVTFCHVDFSCYFNVIVSYQRLCLRRTFTFRAFTRRIYAKRLTISTHTSTQMSIHLWAKPRLSLLCLLVPLNISLSRFFSTPQSNKSIFLPQKVCTGLLLVAEWSHVFRIFSPFFLSWIQINVKCYHSINSIWDHFHSNKWFYPIPFSTY